MKVMLCLVLTLLSNDLILLPMGLHVKISLLCMISIILIQQAVCGSNNTKPEADRWTCSCSISPRENSNFIAANCSSSCNCNPVEVGSTESSWVCICTDGGLPISAIEDNNWSCFRSCNCVAGTSPELETPKKQLSIKTVVIALVICVAIIALAFAALLLCYLSRKDKNSLACAPSSSGRLTSYSSATNSMSPLGSSATISKLYIDTSVKPFIGCIPMSSFLFGSRTGAIHGTLIQFPYSELENMTKRFSDANLIGVGGSSHVYRGYLRDGTTVAIKKMKTQAGLDAEHVFFTEIELISKLHHCHVVSLLGYCSENQGKHAARLLVFEYSPNGNLRECLDGESGKLLDWNTRIAVALGAARGLEYLHEAAAPRILHRDVKSTNILLDEKWKAKITDLGMAKHLQNDGAILSCSSSPARMQGTFGYFAPEYAIVGRASLKSDVFSFGVVLLELITGRKPIHKSSNKSVESLVIWATPRLQDSKRVILELPDPRLKGNFQEEEMQVMAYLAKECLLVDPDSRPSMSEVVQILSTIAPSKSKRKNLPLCSLQRFPFLKYHSVEEQPCYTSEMEEIKTTTFEVKRNEREAEDAFTDIEKLKLLTSKLPEDEMVDLTEPRLESFCLTNFDYHIVKFAA